MPLKQFYTDEAQIPTELKSEYVLKDGRYELQVEGFESLSGIFTKNSELITKQKTDKADIDRSTAEIARLNGEIGKLSGDLSKAQSTAVPTGYVAVSKKDSEVIAALKDRNLKPEEVLTNLTDAENLRKENANFKLNQSIAEFAKAENISNIDALTRLIKQDGVTPQIKEVDENGKKVKKGFLVSGGDAGEETTYADYKTANWNAFASALDHAEQPKPGATRDPKPSGEKETLFERIRKEAETKRENAPKVMSLRDLAARI